MKELIRPWKLATLAVGLAFLYWGAFNLNCPDWSVGNSTVMGFYTYLMAPFSARVLVKRQWMLWPVAAFFWWFCVDGLYVAWNGLEGIPVYRQANFWASSALFWLCGFIWMPKASIKEALASPRSVRI